MPTTFAELIALAPWREAVTYRDTWPHEYVLSHADDQQALLATICARLLDGEGVSCRFFHIPPQKARTDHSSLGRCPNHISKTALPTVNLGPPFWTAWRLPK